MVHGRAPDVVGRMLIQKKVGLNDRSMSDLERLGE